MDDDRPMAVLSSTEKRPAAGPGTHVLMVCMALVVGLPLVGIGAGVAVVLFRGITGL